eukprot:TRINITY_DN152_c0_g1_i7.p1 TRINITY_DN152_c0_g1~~TRINITY_DN152_c0_g1_i7.p1  ORF type:complete len:158 (+),score=20.75 TRINITY_DN152_c0_g1_i7:64-537(+)
MCIRDRYQRRVHGDYYLSSMKLVLFFLMVLTAIYADSCGGNCPSGRCPRCPCGTVPHKIDIAAICQKHSWSQKCCQCIVQHESGGNEKATGYNTNGSFDVGVFQINQMNWGSCSGGEPPCDAERNLKCAIKVYQWGGNTWKLWSTAKGCGCANTPQK